MQERNRHTFSTSEHSKSLSRPGLSQQRAIMYSYMIKHKCYLDLTLQLSTNGGLKCRERLSVCIICPFKSP